MTLRKNVYTHAEAQSDIAAMADGMLSADRQSQLQIHLDSCAECRAYQQEFLQLEKSLGELFQNRVPSGEYTPADNQNFVNEIKATAHVLRPVFQVPQWLNSLAWGSALTLIMIGMAWVLANTRLEEQPPLEPPPSLALSLTSPPGNHFTFDGDGASANQVAFSPDNSLLASAYGNGEVKLWQLATQETYLTLDADQRGVSSIAFAPNGLLFTLGQDNGTLKVWQSSNGQLIQTLADIPGNPRYVGISPDGAIQFLRQPNELILNPNPGVRVPWAMGRGAHHPPIILPAMAGEVVTASVSPDGKILATGSKTGMIRLWEITYQNGQLQGHLLFRLEGHTSSITSLVFHPGGQWLVSASHDGTARVWEMQEGRYLYMLLRENSAIHSLAFSPNGAALAAALADGTVNLWVTIEK